MGLLMNDHKRLEKWVWILIYGGLLGASLGWFVEARNAGLGLALMIVGGLAAGAGVALIFVRSRLRP